MLRNINRIAVGMTLVVPKPARGTEEIVEAEAAPEAEAAEAAEKPEPVAAVKPAPAPAPRPRTVHVVRRGESLSVIARRYRVRVSDLVRWNGLRDASHIVVGQRLRLTAPGEAPQEAPAVASSGSSAKAASSSGVTGSHTVQRGETLSIIARRYGVSLADLQAWNNIADPSRIVVGQKLTLRGGTNGVDGWSTYTVRRGDSLNKIASAYGVSVESLRSWNGLRGTTIYPGQKLKLRR